MCFIEHPQSSKSAVLVFMLSTVLPFIPLLNADGVVAGVDDGLSEPITIINEFPLGCMRKSKVYVSVV